MYNNLFTIHLLIQSTYRVIFHHVQIHFGSHQVPYIVQTVFNHGGPLQRQPPRYHVDVVRQPHGEEHLWTENTGVADFYPFTEPCKRNDNIIICYMRTVVACDCKNGSWGSTFTRCHFLNLVTRQSAALSSDIQHTMPLEVVGKTSSSVRNGSIITASAYPAVCGIQWSYFFFV